MSDGDQPNAVASFTFLLDSIEFALGGDLEQRQLGWQAPSKGLAHTLHVCKETYDAYQKLGTSSISLELHHSLQGRYNRICKVLA